MRVLMIGHPQLRNFLVNTTTDFLTSSTQVLTTTNIGMAIQKGQAISIMTNIGSPVRADRSVRDAEANMFACAAAKPLTPRVYPLRRKPSDY